MPGSGFTQFMISSIKSNSRRKKREQFNKKDIYKFGLKKSNPKFKKATKEQLENIKKRLQRRNRVYKRKLIIYSAISSVFLFLLIVLTIKYF